MRKPWVWSQKISDHLQPFLFIYLFCIATTHLHCLKSLAVHINDTHYSTQTWASTDVACSLVHCWICSMHHVTSIEHTDCNWILLRSSHSNIPLTSGFSWNRLCHRNLVPSHPGLTGSSLCCAMWCGVEVQPEATTGTLSSRELGPVGMKGMRCLHQDL